MDKSQESTYPLVSTHTDKDSSCPISTSSLTVSDPVTFAHSLTIKNFSGSRPFKDGEALKSANFSHFGTTWCAEVYPNQHIKAETLDERYISVYLRLINSPGGEGVHARFSVAILKANGDVVQKKYTPTCGYRIFECESHGRAGFTKYIPSMHVLDELKGYMSNNNLTLMFAVKMILATTDHQAQAQEDWPPRQMREELQQFMQDDFLTDVTVSAGNGKSFRAHRAILAAGSSYFAGKFRFDKGMTARPKYKVDVEEVPGEVMGEIIHYMYFGNVENLERHVIEILKAADKFNMDKLVALCEDHLIENLQVGNVCQIAIQTKQIVSAARLKQKCRKLLFDNREAGLPGIEQIFEEHVDIVHDLWKNHKV